MKVLIVSDTHGKNDLYLQLIKQLGHLDMIIHCGDVEGSEYLIDNSADCPVKMVCGNNDFFSELPMECEFQVGLHKVFLTHGHTYRVSFDKDSIAREASMRGADIAIYGHTHRPLVEVHNGVTLVNPGSLSYPRQDDRTPTYIIMETSGSDAVFNIYRTTEKIPK